MEGEWEKRPEQLTLEILLQQGDWMRALAGYLVQEPAAVDDVLQDVWVAALRSPPDPARPARPWLAQVMRNLVRTGARQRVRWRAREARAAEPDVTAVPSADEVLARTQLHRDLAEEMTALEGPYRTTLLLRFFENQSSEEIGRRCGVPAGTARWRVNESVQRLRQRLDARHGGRQAWLPILLPVRRPVPPPVETARRLALSPARRLPWANTSLVAIGLLGAGGVALLTWRLRAPRFARPAPAIVAVAPAPNPDPKEANMNKQSSKRLGAFVMGALPVLVAGSQVRADVAALIEEGAGMCVEMREKVFECEDEFAQAFVAQRNPPPERRRALVRQALEEIAADGSGPVEPRRERCRAMIKPMAGAAKAPESELRGKLDGMKKMLAFCSAKESCAERVECMMPFMRPGGGRAKP